MFSLVFQAGLLWFLIDKVCGTAQKTTVKICAWYFGITIGLQMIGTVIAGWLSPS